MSWILEFAFTQWKSMTYNKIVLTSFRKSLLKEIFGMFYKHVLFNYVQRLYCITKIWPCWTWLNCSLLSVTEMYGELVRNWQAFAEASQITSFYVIKRGLETALRFKVLLSAWFKNVCIQSCDVFPTTSTHFKTF